MKLTDKQIKAIVAEVDCPNWFKNYYVVAGIEVTDGITVMIWTPISHADFEVEFYDERTNKIIHYENEDDLICDLNEKMQEIMDEQERNCIELRETERYLSHWLDTQRI